MDTELLDLLRADLEAADYRAAPVAALLGETADSARQRAVFTPALRVLAERGPSALAALIRLFLLGDRLSPAELDAAFPSLGVAGARRLGIVRGADAAAGLLAALSLNPVALPDPTAADAATNRDWWFLSDLDDQLRRGPARPDHVMGVGGATRSLIALAPFGGEAPGGPPGRALDLGTGCGVVALFLAAAGVPQVVATDISERALLLAAANARLNGLDGRVEFRHGDLFAPVTGEHFELIMSNPPFVITPRGDDGAPRYEYRDAGLVGDELAARVVSAAPAHLAEGGVLLCLANWETPWGGNGLDRVRGWIDGAAAAPLAGWVIERDRLDPVRYAETWARDGGARPGEPAFDTLMSDWLRDFAERRVVAIGLGSIRVQRLAVGSARTVRLEQAAGAFGEAPGPVLAAAFAVGVAADGMSDAEVLAERWVLHDGVTEVREHRPGEESPRSISLTSERGIARRVTADTLLAAAVGACDGELSLGRIAGALATLLEVDEAAAGEALAAGARELAWFGMLAPAGAAGAARGL